MQTVMTIGLDIAKSVTMSVICTGQGGEGAFAFDICVSI